MDLISIVMPVYNSKEYINIAIESVLKQTFSNFELIIVDDGSYDGSEKICDLYALKDSRIKVIHKNNGGVCSARNLGIKKAKGKYITFLDNDDEYDESYLNKMYNVILSKKSDIVKCSRRNIKIDSNFNIINEKYNIYENIDLNFDEFAMKYYDIKKSNILGSVWNSLYKKEIIDLYNITFDRNVKHGNEDIIFNSQYLCYCNKISIISDVLYTHYYRINHSTSMKFYDDQIDSRIKALNLELNIMKKYKNSNQYNLLQIDGIRDCFRILQQSDNKKIKKEQIKKIKNKLNFKLLKNTKIIGNKTLSIEQKLDLFFIKYELFSFYFFLRRLKKY